MPVHQDYREFVISLNAHRVKYLIVGAHAVGFYAIPHYTKDIDFWVEPSKQNTKKILKTLRDFFGTDFGLSIDALSDPKTILQFGVEPIRIDIITSICGVGFKTAWRNRTISRYGSEPANYISLNDLIRTKRATRRRQDLEDLKQLTRLKKEKR